MIQAQLFKNDDTQKEEKLLNHLVFTIGCNLYNSLTRQLEGGKENGLPKAASHRQNSNQSLETKNKFFIYSSG